MALAHISAAELETNDEARKALLQLVKDFSPTYKAKFLAAVTRVAMPLREEADAELFKLTIEEQAQMIARTTWCYGEQHNETILIRALEIVRAIKKPAT